MRLGPIDKPEPFKPQSVHCPSCRLGLVENQTRDPPLFHRLATAWASNDKFLMAPPELRKTGISPRIQCLFFLVALTVATIFSPALGLGANENFFLYKLIGVSRLALVLAFVIAISAQSIYVIAGASGPTDGSDGTIALKAGLAVTLFSLLIAFSLAELGVRVLLEFRGDPPLDYPDAVGGGLKEGGLLKANFKARLADGYGGSIDWVTNAQGFRNETEFSRKPPPGVLRILSLGDSFAAASRIDQHESYAYLIERWANRTFGKTEVLVSMIANPVVGLSYLQRFGIEFRPHVVVLGLTIGNDLAETLAAIDPRGTHDLDDETGIIVKRDAPATLGATLGSDKYGLPDHAASKSRLTWSYAFRYMRDRLRIVALLEANSFAFFPDRPAAITASIPGFDARMFDPSHGLGFYLADPPPIVTDAYRRLYRVLAAFDKFTRANGVKLVVILFGQRFEVQGPDWKQTRWRYQLEDSAFDLELPGRTILGYCRKLAITCIDPSAAMRRLYEAGSGTLYLPMGDMHWNRKGHQALFEASKPILEKVLESAAPAR